jgi:hypothetical protein
VSELAMQGWQSVTAQCRYSNQRIHFQFSVRSDCQFSLRFEDSRKSRFDIISPPFMLYT